jgi:hypothetical protein
MTGPLWVTFVRILHRVLSFVLSKNSPPPTTYDKPGKPFSRLLAATGCSAGAGAIACLQKVPFAVGVPLDMNVFELTVVTYTDASEHQ